MERHIVKIREIENTTHDVLKIVTEKPRNYSFTPGQATDIIINKKDLTDKKNPYTFTSLPKDDFLEFTIKIYPSRDGLTNDLQELKVDDELILHEVFGAIHYKGEGTFIAGGAGVTPFISILRDLESKNEIGGNTLLFANKTKEDIILEEEREDNNHCRNNNNTVESKDISYETSLQLKMDHKQSICDDCFRLG